jgi:hypothetical protein
MKKVITAGIAGLFAILFTGIALADDLTITYTVPEVSEMITDVGDGITFTFVEPAAGHSFADVTDTFTISVTDNTGSPMRVVARVSSTPPECDDSNIYLLAVASPGVGTPGPEVSINNLDQDLITGIQSESGSSTVTLRLQADMTACTITNGTATFVITYCAES